MAIIGRNFIAGDRNTSDKLRKLGLAIEIEEEKLNDIDMIIKELKRLKYRYKDYRFEDNNKDIAKSIYEFLRGE